MRASLAVPPPPPFDVLECRPVTWTGWVLRQPRQHRAHCKGRGCSAKQWTAYGTTDPAHHEYVDGVLVTDWPTFRLVALSCLSCGTVRVYDLVGEGWAEVLSEPGTGQLSLFPNVPQQQRRAP